MSHHSETTTFDRIVAIIITLGTIYWGYVLQSREEAAKDAAGGAACAAESLSDARK